MQKCSFLRSCIPETETSNVIMKGTNKMQLYRSIYFSLSTLHISSDVFAHHQEHLTVFTVSGSIHQGWCRLVSGMGFNSSNTPAGSDICEHYQIL